MAGVPAISEKEFQRQVVRLARMHGWRVYHTRDSRGSDKGFPDLVLVKGKRVLWAELKGAKGRLRPEQRAWLEALEEAGCDARLWRPGDWPEIERTLRA